MKMIITTTPVGHISLRYLGPVVACILLVATLLACTGRSEDPGKEERTLELEATVRSLEESVETLEDQNTLLQSEIASLQERLDDLDAQSLKFGDDDPKAEWDNSSMRQWSKNKDEKTLSMPVGNALERTARLAEDAGGVVHYIEHPGRQDRTVLVTPQEFVDGEIPLIVSLHGFGGNSADHSAYFPFHEHVNTRGFALLLPNGSLNSEGLPFWNPTDECCDSSKAGEDDVAYLTELIAEARAIKDFGPIHFFGYSNGGFMAYHMACKGLPGLRAVASVAGTSYVEDSSCYGAPPVSVLHIHGTEDSVIMFEGDETEMDSNGERVFYASAQDMVTRWSLRAGCAWPENPQLLDTIDLDQHVPGAETQIFATEESDCVRGIGIGLLIGVGSSHSPGYGDTFIEGLLNWFLAHE